MATPELSMSAKDYMERRVHAAQETLRRPGPRQDLKGNLVHSIPLSPPLPTPEVLVAEGNMPPDAGMTQPWPHGTEELT